MQRPIGGVNALAPGMDACRSPLVQSVRLGRPGLLEEGKGELHVYQPQLDIHSLRSGVPAALAGLMSLDVYVCAAQYVCNFPLAEDAI